MTRATAAVRRNRQTDGETNRPFGGRSMATTTQPITLRLDAEVVEQVRALATIQARSMNDVLRDAIGGYVQSVSAEPGFREQLDDSLDRMRSLFASRTAA